MAATVSAAAAVYKYETGLVERWSSSGLDEEATLDGGRATRFGRPAAGEIFIFK